MRIVSWNCNGYLGQKEIEAIKKLEAQIYVIQECTPKIKDLNPFGGFSYWFGDDIEGNRGISLFSSDFQLKPLFDPQKIKYRFVLPFRIIGTKIILFAVWTKKYTKQNKLDYIQHVWGAINDSEFSNLLDKQTILIGDFNSNKIWDTAYRDGNHTKVGDFLKQKKIFCLCQEGKQDEPTLYWRYNLDSPYLVDYCFASESFKTKQIKIEIGKKEEWVVPKLSDHCPIIVDFEW